MSFKAFDYTGSKYTLPKAMTVAELLKLYKTKTTGINTKLGYSYLAYKEKGGDLVSDSTTIGELEPKTLYLDYAKKPSAISIKIAYEGESYVFDVNSKCVESESGKAISIIVEPTTTGEELRALFTSSSTEHYYMDTADDIPALKLTYGNDSKILKSSQTLSSAGINDGDTITVLEFTPATYKFKISRSEQAKSNSIDLNAYVYDLDNYQYDDSAYPPEWVSFTMTDNDKLRDLKYVISGNSGMLAYGKTIILSKDNEELYYTSKDSYVSEFGFDSSANTVNELTLYGPENFEDLKTGLGLSDEELPVYKINFALDDQAMSYYKTKLEKEDDIVIPAYDCCDRSELTSIVDIVSKNVFKYDSNIDIYWNDTCLFRYAGNVERTGVFTLDSIAGLKKDGTDTFTIKLSPKSDGDYSDPIDDQF